MVRQRLLHKKCLSTNYPQNNPMSYINQNDCHIQIQISKIFYDSYRLIIVLKTKTCISVQQSVLNVKIIILICWSFWLFNKLI